MSPCFATTALYGIIHIIIRMILLMGATLSHSMNRMFQNKTLIGLVFILLTLFLLSSASSLRAAPSPDAIAIRVMPNLGHLSPLKWYGENIKLQGSPQVLTVDGYEAVRDGRTVYVNAANIAGSSLYTNIYIISYNQAAEDQTVDIFGQILAHWKFNANVSDPAAAHCSKTTARVCLYTTDWPANPFPNGPAGVLPWATRWA